jgi:erythromycin esterase
MTGAALTALVACEPQIEEGRIPLALTGSKNTGDLTALGKAIGDRRIVLLGENGHGVGEFSELKVRLVEWLHREKGFDVVAMESGFWECSSAGENATDARVMFHDCLSYPFQQAELLPLFDRLLSTRDSERPLRLAGIDIQAQGYDSELKPLWTRSQLGLADIGLAERVTHQDSMIFLPAALGGLGDEVYPWLVDSGAVVAARYDSAAALTTGLTHWVYRMSRGLVNRLQLRADANASGSPRPGRYYQLRDEWMARSILALADSISGSRKVVVWLHNDHGRYGGWSSGDLEVESAGGFLRDWTPDEVFSIGFFMGKGAITDNGRNLQEVIPGSPGGIEEFMVGDTAARYLILAGNSSAEVRAFADSSRPYNRMGTTAMTMIPADEFDALVMVDSVGPPEYRVP